MRIEVPEDGGNAEVHEVSGDGARLGIRPDNAADYRQWFWFRCVGVRGRPVELRIDTTGSSYPRGWIGYSAVTCAGGDDWVRVPTRLDGDELVVTLTSEQDVADVAYFAPYPTSRRAARLARLPHEVLCTSPDGLPVAMIELGRGPTPIWIVGRQHPGEAMGEWFVEGLVDALLGDDPRVREILDRVTFRLVPCVNVDGARRGNHRTNALGRDLNRAWFDPPPQAPEVRAIRDRMDRTGVAFALDVHGEEEIPHNFASGAEGTPSWDEPRAALKRRFLAAWAAATPDFQTTHGYAQSAPGEANLTVFSNGVTERYRCVALTVEQPFADHADRPDPRAGWSPERARRLGASVLAPISAVLPDLGR